MKRPLIMFALLVMLTGGTCAKKQGKIFYINSYHRGYGSSDGIMAGIESTLIGKNVIMETFYMDTKRYPEEDSIRIKTTQALNGIKRFRPDVILVSDDDAVKYVITPYFRNGPVPTVFCGVNWSCKQYGLPTPYVTGMLEVLPVEKSIMALKTYYPQIRKLMVISENTNSERSNKFHLDPRYRALDLEPSYRLVNTFDAWKEAFIEANRTADFIFLPTNGGIMGWVDEEAAAFVHKHIRVPVFSCDDFMMQYAVLGFTKVAGEQGEWAVKTAMEILSGRDPKDIPVVENKLAEGYFNPGLAEKIGFHPDRALLDRCQIVFSKTE